MAASDDGFSTLEALVAFAVLSLGLLGAVQSISQAAISLKKSADGQGQVALLQQLRSEEVPALALRYAGAPLVADGASWRIELAPVRSDVPDGPVGVKIWIGHRGGPLSGYFGVLGGTSSSSDRTGDGLRQ